MYNSNNEFFMSPKNDYVFKKIFGDENNKDILSSFLSCVINEQINDVSILNNEITKENTADK
ncbi:MAG: PD-(D/E)XK nuclease family transposase, partial [Clostridium butyricum]|nr:PD-(D/E)XK nuclease family transposase [Clostridium butyricum]MDU4803085.1 PD-(D/E)XK nuclease family transposase [Clostridium butyricum]